MALRHRYRSFRRLVFEPLEHRRVLAAGFDEFVDPHPAAGNQFGASVVPLSTGNVVITSPFDDTGGTDAGAVYLFSGRTGALISTLIGSHTDDHVGSGGVTALTNGNFVVGSPSWDSDTAQDVGAATWGSGTIGISGVISAANSLVGTSPFDSVAEGFLRVRALTNGNYVVPSPHWDHEGIADVGAATFGNGTTGITGQISAANSLIGSAEGDQVAYSGILLLTNGNYVVSSTKWNNGTIANAGAVTFGNGTTGIVGTVNSANSLVGSHTIDRVGFVMPLPNGNYLVTARFWNGDRGEVTFGDGTVGVSGVVGADNSLVGTTPGDLVGTVFLLSNGNYIVPSTGWDNGTIPDAGAVTFASETTGITGQISAANSMIGSSANDLVGEQVAILSNGNYVVISSEWNDGAKLDVGAVTLGDGTVGVQGTVSAANSLIGSHNSDRVGSGRVTALTNGNYVIASPLWDDAGAADVGAVTFGNGTSGVVGQISSGNSLIGATTGDQIGGGVGLGSVFALTNGNYLVQSPLWDNGNLQDAGAVTFGNGASGTTGLVSAINSLVGSSAGDKVGLGYNAFHGLALANGNYVIASPLWDHGDIADVGAVTFGNGQTGVIGPVSEMNSMIGSTANDQVGGGGSGIHFAALLNGNYVIGSPNWDNGDIADVGAVTLGDGLNGASGILDSSNSLVGSHPDDQISDAMGFIGVQPLSSGNFVVVSPSWDNGSIQNVGAVTFGDGSTGVIGPIGAENSAIGASADSGLQYIITDDLNQTFYARFSADGGGRVRVGSQIDGFAHQWHLAAKPLDVNNDGHIVAGDALAIINYINAGFPTAVAADAQLGKPYGFLDVSGDDNVAPGDALDVINAINAGQRGEGESSSVGERAIGGAGESAGGMVKAIDELMSLLAMDAVDQNGRPRMR